MLDIAFIRQNPEAVRTAAQNKRMEVDVDGLLAADKERREVLVTLEAKRQKKNELSAQIPKASKDDRPKLVDEAKAVRTEIESLEPKLSEIERRLEDLMLRVPSIPRPEVPLGKGEEDNVEIRKVGTPRTFSFAPKDHVALMSELGLVNWDGPRKYAGARSYALTGMGALLELAVTRLAVDILIAKGLTLVLPPVIVKDRALQGTGFFPLGREEAYSIPADDLFLVGTSEVPLVSLHCDETLDHSQLPMRYAGMSPCFRREAGAHGKDTKGLYRVHQFTKVEMVVIATPEQSEAMHKELLANERAIFDALELPYRVLDICTGDLGGAAYRKYDLEAWMPGRGDGGEFGEVTSTSNCTEFQARRLNIRYRKGPKDKPLYVHTLNGTGIALGRAMVAILENNQLEDGSVRLPKVLQPFMGQDRIVPRTKR